MDANFFFFFFSQDHGCKNFKKALVKLGKKHPEIKAISQKAGGALHSIIKKSNGNSHLFLEEVERRVEHFCGDHTKCKQCRKNFIPIMDLNAQKAFKVQLT
jgi:hypothetical protein